MILSLSKHITTDTDSVECEHGKCIDCQMWDLASSAPILAKNFILLLINSELPTFPDFNNNLLPVFNPKKQEKQIVPLDKIEIAIKEYINAETKARQARFEHGETPNIKEENK